jgi:hypothetical protein
MFDFNEMKRIVNLTEEERKQNRENALKGVYALRYATQPIRDIDELIHRVEDSVLEIGDLVMKREEEDMFSPSIQAMLHDTIDILDYLKEFKQQN